MYSITYRGKAADEYSAAIKWYEERSLQAAENFMDAVNERLDALSDHPAKYKKVYKKYHEVKTRKYPYTIVYFIAEELQQVIIVAIYHSKRRPSGKYRK